MKNFKFIVDIGYIVNLHSVEYLLSRWWTDQFIIHRLVLFIIKRLAYKGLTYFPVTQEVNFAFIVGQSDLFMFLFQCNN